MFLRKWRVLGRFRPGSWILSDPRPKPDTVRIRPRRVPEDFTAAPQSACSDRGASGVSFGGPRGLIMLAAISWHGYKLGMQGYESGYQGPKPGDEGPKSGKVCYKFGRFVLITRLRTLITRLTTLHTRLITMPSYP